MRDELQILGPAPVAKPRRTAHIKVRTAAIHGEMDDMVRYISYRGIPETETPIRVRFRSHGSAVVVHRFQEGEFTFFRKPSNLNDYWVSGGIDRFRSFDIPLQGANNYEAEQVLH